MQLALCLGKLEIPFADSRDSKGFATFFGILPEQLIVPGLAPNNFWFFNISSYPIEAVGAIFTCGA